MKQPMPEREDWSEIEERLKIVIHNAEQQILLFKAQLTEVQKNIAAEIKPVTKL